MGTTLDSIQRKLWLSSVENTKASHTTVTHPRGTWDEKGTPSLSAWRRQLQALTAAPRTLGPHAQGSHFALFQNLSWPSKSTSRSQALFQMPDLRVQGYHVRTSFLPLWKVGLTIKQNKLCVDVRTCVLPTWMSVLQNIPLYLNIKPLWCEMLISDKRYTHCYWVFLFFYYSSILFWGTSREPAHNSFGSTHNSLSSSVHSHCNLLPLASGRKSILSVLCLNLKCPPKPHVLKTWPLAGVLFRSDWTRRIRLLGGEANVEIGLCLPPVPPSLVFYFITDRTTTPDENMHKLGLLESCQEFCLAKAAE